MRIKIALMAALTVLSFGISRLDAAPPAAKLKPIDDISHVQVPTVDRDVMRIIDDQERAEGLPPRYAVPHPTSITPDTGGTWEILSPETRLWRLRVSSPGAVSINIGFTQYEMPTGASLVLRSVDGRYSIRPFNDGDNNAARQLWTPPVAGGDMVIELTMPTAMLGRYSLEVGSINIGYRRFGAIADPNEVTPRSGACNVDVVCSTGDPWRLQIPGVAVISTGGSTFCTGSLLNNTSNDRKPYFLTANHCGVNSGNSASLVAFWNYENSVCRGIPGGGGVGDGSLAEFSTGATFRAALAASDFTLVEFNAPINPAFMVSYLGWDRTDTFPPSGACIHHPSTDEKRITLYDIAVRPTRPTHGSSWGCSAFPGPGDGSHISVYWSLGVTEPGSSGSPLFDNNKRVIGQLHGGPSACGQTGDNLSDCYGRVWRSWTGGGTAATRLSNWLDATNTGATAVDTISGAGLSVAPSGNVTSVGLVGGPFTNPSTLYTISNPGTDPANYTVSFVGGGTAPLLMNGGAGPLGGTLNPTQSTNVTIDIDASAANALSAGI
jgi:lysyl endopeptidase